MVDINGFYGCVYLDRNNIFTSTSSTTATYSWEVQRDVILNLSLDFSKMSSQRNLSLAFKRIQTYLSNVRTWHYRRIYSKLSFRCGIHHKVCSNWQFRLNLPSLRDTVANLLLKTLRMDCNLTKYIYKWHDNFLLHFPFFFFFAECNSFFLHQTYHSF